MSERTEVEALRRIAQQLLIAEVTIREAALEEAAGVCEGKADSQSYQEREAENACLQCASAIRALKEKRDE